jgi:hypothetical protein
MVRPDLRRDMAGVPEYQAFRRRERCGTHHPEGTSSLWVATVPSGEPGSRDKSVLREEEREREITALHVRRTHQGREDLEGRLASGGWQLEACWGGGTSL